MLDFLFPAQKKQFEEHVKFALQQLIISEVNADSDIEAISNTILQKTEDDLLACRLLVFIPIIVTREYYKPTGIKLSPCYSRNIGNGKSETVYFEDQPVYCQIEKVIQKEYSTLSSQDILNILEHSSEHKTIREAQLRGLQIVSPPVIATGDI